MKGAIADTRDERENKGDGNGIELLDRLRHAMCYRADDRRGGEETLTDEREKSASPIFQRRPFDTSSFDQLTHRNKPGRAGPGRAVVDRSGLGYFNMNSSKVSIETSLPKLGEYTTQ